MKRRQGEKASKSPSGAGSPSSAVLIDSIFPSDLSPNAVVGVRTGLPNFTARERSAILDDAGDKISRSGKCCRVDQKYRQTQPRDLTVFSPGVARAHSETVKWFGCGQSQRPQNLFHQIILLFSKSRRRLTIELISSTEVKLSYCFFYDIPRQPTPDHATPLFPLNCSPGR